MLTCIIPTYVFEAISTDYIKQRRNKPAVISRKKDAAHMKQRKEIKKLGKKSLKNSDAPEECFQELLTSLLPALYLLLS